MGKLKRLESEINKTMLRVEFVPSQARPWSRASATAAAPYESARSSSRATRRRKKPKSTTPSSPQMCTEGKSCSCTPSSVSKGVWTPWRLPSATRKCRGIYSCANAESFMYLFILTFTAASAFPTILAHSHCSYNYSFHGVNYTLPGKWPASSSCWIT